VFKIPLAEVGQNAAAAAVRETEAPATGRAEHSLSPESVTQPPRELVLIARATRDFELVHRGRRLAGLVTWVQLGGRGRRY
jgi:hypothetical protein